MISICAVTRNTKEWIELLVKSVRLFTYVPHELIIVDNDSSDGTQEWLKAQGDVQGIMSTKNIGHGFGLDLAIGQAKYRFVMVLDGDAHFMRKNWDFDFLDLYGKHPRRRLIAAKGSENPDAPKAKPIHAAFQFFERQFFHDAQLSFAPREGHDVGRKNYYDIVAKGYEVFRLPPGYERPGEKFYKGAYGDVYYLDLKPVIYHNWYSARFYKRTEVDGYKIADFEHNKAVLFDQPLVKEILAS